MKAITASRPTVDALLSGNMYILTAKHSTDYRGRLAIHVAQRKGYNPALCWRHDLAVIHTGTANVVQTSAIVATCTLVDCAPIGGPTDFSTGLVEGEPPAFADRAVVVRHPALGPCDESLVLDDPGKGPRDISDQLPYGNFRPGHWALFLEDVQPVEARCPACWSSGSHPYPTRKLCRLCQGKLRVAPVPARGGPGDLWDWEPR